MNSTLCMCGKTCKTMCVGFVLNLVVIRLLLVLCPVSYLFTLYVSARFVKSRGSSFQSSASGIHMHLLLIDALT